MNHLLGIEQALRNAKHHHGAQEPKGLLTPQKYSSLDHVK